MNNALQEIKYLLDSKYKTYNRPDFIQSDPIQIPHRFGKKEDIEISGLLTATIAWGQRSSIIKNASQLMSIMDNSPYEFIMNEKVEDMEEILRKSGFVHRTFNSADCAFFLQSIKNIYSHYVGLETVFTDGYKQQGNITGALMHFRKVFLSVPHAKRVEKHISDIKANSGAKRLNMFLRWMVREDNYSVDFGLWKNIPASALCIPLDVHSGDVARALGILNRKQNDWKAVTELMEVLREFDPIDPVKYDFALFGIGAFEKKAATVDFL